MGIAADFYRNLKLENFQKDDTQFLKSLETALSNDKIPIYGIISMANNSKKEDGSMTIDEAIDRTISFKDEGFNIYRPNHLIDIPTLTNLMGDKNSRNLPLYEIKINDQFQHDEKHRSDLICHFIATDANLLDPSNNNIIVNVLRYKILSSYRQKITRVERVCLFEKDEAFENNLDFETDTVIFLKRTEKATVFIKKTGVEVYDNKNDAFLKWLNRKLEADPGKTYTIKTLKMLFQSSNPTLCNELINLGVEDLQDSPWIRLSELFPSEIYCQSDYLIDHRASFTNRSASIHELRLIDYLMELLDPRYVVIDRKLNS